MPRLGQDITVGISADASGLSRGLNRARGEVSGFANGLGRLQGGLGGLTNSITAVTSSFSAFADGARLAVDALQAIDKIAQDLAEQNSLAQAFGLARQEYEAFARAIGASLGEISEARDLLGDFQESVALLQRGEAKELRLFRELGLGAEFASQAAQDLDGSFITLLERIEELDQTAARGILTELIGADASRRFVQAAQNIELIRNELSRPFLAASDEAIREILELAAASRTASAQLRESFVEALGLSELDDTIVGLLGSFGNLRTETDLLLILFNRIAIAINGFRLAWEAVTADFRGFARIFNNSRQILRNEQQTLEELRQRIENAEVGTESGADTVDDRGLDRVVEAIETQTTSLTESLTAAFKNAVEDQARTLSDLQNKGLENIAERIVTASDPEAQTVRELGPFLDAQERQLTTIFENNREYFESLQREFGLSGGGQPVTDVQAALDNLDVSFDVPPQLTAEQKNQLQVARDQLEVSRQQLEEYRMQQRALVPGVVDTEALVEELNSLTEEYDTIIKSSEENTKALNENRAQQEMLSRSIQENANAQTDASNELKAAREQQLQGPGIASVGVGAGAGAAALATLGRSLARFLPSVRSATQAASRATTRAAERSARASERAKEAAESVKQGVQNISPENIQRAAQLSAGDLERIAQTTRRESQRIATLVGGGTGGVVGGAGGALTRRLLFESQISGEIDKLENEEDSLNKQRQQSEQSVAALRDEEERLANERSANRNRAAEIIEILQKQGNVGNQFLKETKAAFDEVTFDSTATDRFIRETDAFWDEWFDTVLEEQDKFTESAYQSWIAYFEFHAERSRRLLLEAAFGPANRTARRQTEEVGNAWESLIRSASSQFSQFLSNVIFDVNNLEEAFDALIRSIAGSLISAGVGEIVNNLFPGRQSGGPVSAGRIYQTHGLGQREYFTPDQDGYIVTGSPSSRQPVVFNVNMTVGDIASSRDVEAGVYAALERAADNVNTPGTRLNRAIVDVAGSVN